MMSRSISWNTKPIRISGTFTDARHSTLPWITLAAQLVLQLPEEAAVAAGVVVAEQAAVAAVEQALLALALQYLKFPVPVQLHNLLPAAEVALLDKVVKPARLLAVEAEPAAVVVAAVAVVVLKPDAAAV